MSRSSSKDAARAALARADRWLYEQGRIALRRICDTSADAVLRSVKARTEIVFWWRYVSPDLNSRYNVALLTQMERNDLGFLLSIFRHNPELSSLFFALFFPLKGRLTELEQHDVNLLADYLLSYPRERTLFRTLDHCHSTSLFFGEKWPGDTARSLLRESCLPLSGNILIQDEDLSYAVTHTFFYATDFGKDLTLLGEFPDAPFAEFLGYLARTAIAAGDTDILSELLLCLMFIGETRSIDADALDYLIASQSGQGFWPATRAVVDAVQADGMPDEQVTFFAHYHTTMLARDVLARQLSTASARRKAAGRLPQDSGLKEGRGHRQDNLKAVDPVESVLGNPRVRHMVQMLQAAERAPGLSCPGRHQFDVLFRKMAENDFVGTAMALPVLRPAPRIEKLVRFFHAANKSKLTGYGFPNPRGPNYGVDRVVMALAGDLIEKRISGWDCEGRDIESHDSIGERPLEPAAV